MTLERDNIVEAKSIEGEDVLCKLLANQRMLQGVAYENIP